MFEESLNNNNRQCRVSWTQKKDTESVNRVEEKLMGMDMVSSKIRAAYRGVPSHPFKATLAMVCFNFGLLLLVSQMLFNSHHHESRI
jgi:hypothetical protein